MRLEAEGIKILLAEDNEINREVVLDILEPLNMEVDTAENGEEAIEKVINGKYDLVFMDYLMPVCDGVKATLAIRKASDRDDLKEMPIIALTASADETDKLIDSGMNDFIIKPLNYDTAVEKLIKWLPKKSVYAVGDSKIIKEQEEPISEIEGIDIKSGIVNSGSQRLLKKLFGDFSKVIDWKKGQIEEYLENGNIDSYRIEVHALKSSANLIGALSLSKEFEELEKLAKEKDIDNIKQKTPAVLLHYKDFKEKLKDYGNAKYSQSVSVSDGRIISILNKIINDANQFFLDGVDADVLELEKCVLPEMLLSDFEQLKVYVSDVSMAKSISLCGEMINKLGGGK